MTRRLIERLVIATTWCAALLILALFATMLAFLAAHAAPALDGHLLFGDADPWRAMIGAEMVWDGLWPALVGSALLTLIALAIALPLGVAAGVAQAEFDSPALRASRAMTDLLSGMPSIVLGLSGFMLIVLLRGVCPTANVSLLLAACCVALLILPYPTVATRQALLRVPAALRLACDALGMTRLQAIRHVYLPECRQGIVAGAVLACGRALEDVAVILLTGAVASFGVPRSVFDPFEALPFFIMVTASEYRDEQQLARAFAAALLLLCLSALLFTLARRLQGKSDR